MRTLCYKDLVGHPLAALDSTPGALFVWRLGNRWKFHQTSPFYLLEETDSCSKRFLPMKMSALRQV